MGLTNLKSLIWTNKCVHKTSKIRLNFTDYFEQLPRKSLTRTRYQCKEVRAGDRGPGKKAIFLNAFWLKYWTIITKQPEN